jgi:hypothetical protein
VRFKQQTITDDLEDDVITGDKINPVLTLTDQTIAVTGSAQITAGGGNVAIGPSGIAVGNSPTGANNIDIYNQVGVRIGRLYGAGTAGNGDITLTADYNGAGFTSVGIYGYDACSIGVNGITIGLNAPTGILYDTGTDSLPHVFMPSSVVIGTSAIPTSAVDGFIYLPTCAGKPTGVPTTQTGTIPRVWDSTNKIMWQYDGGWKALESEGTAMPSSPYTGQRFYRSDLRVEVYYDGTRWVGPEITLPLLNYQGTQPYSSDTEAYACGAISDYPFLVTRFEISYHVFSTNNGGDYWTAELRRLHSGVGFHTIGSVDTSSGFNDTWTHPSALTSFSNNPTAVDDFWWQVYLYKTGSPGNAFILPIVKGRQVYT